MGLPKNNVGALVGAFLAMVIVGFGNALLTYVTNNNDFPNTPALWYQLAWPPIGAAAAALIIPRLSVSELRGTGGTKDAQPQRFTARASRRREPPVTPIALRPDSPSPYTAPAFPSALHPEHGGGDTGRDQSPSSARGGGGSGDDESAESLGGGVPGAGPGLSASPSILRRFGQSGRYPLRGAPLNAPRWNF